MTRRRHTPRKKKIDVADKIEKIILIVVVVVLVLWGITYLFNPSEVKLPKTQSNTSKVVKQERRNIKVSLLNGCGVSGACAQMGKYISDAGFDTVNKGNADSYNYPHTLVIDRKGNKDKAKALALFLGLPETSVITHLKTYRGKKSTVFEDVVLLLGKDFTKIARN